MKIQVEEYVRTTKGFIGKLVQQYTFENNQVTYPEPQEWVLDINRKQYIANEAEYEGIKKHSFNIIDLIEVGDYVNGDKIIKIEEDIYIGGLNLWTERNAPDGFGGFYQVKYREKDIKSIVTKEQFETMEYEVK